MEDIIITDTIQAYQIETGDQILVGTDALENVTVLDDTLDEIIISGFSNDSGDRETYNLHPDDTVHVWSI